MRRDQASIRRSGRHAAGLLCLAAIASGFACTVQFQGSAVAPAVAGRSLDLPLDGMAQMAVDRASGHVFLSSPTSDAIAVVDFQAHLVAMIKNEPGAYGLVLDGSTLYVSLTTVGGIDAIDTASLKVTRYVARGLIMPVPLAEAGGKLWTRNGECGNGPVQLASVDPGTGQTASYSLDGLTYCPAFAPIPSQPKLMLAWESGSSTGYVAVLDVSKSKPTVVRSRRLDGTLGSGSRLITPDGRLFFTGNGHQLGEYRISDLSPDGVIYPGLSAVAISPDGQQLLGAASPPSEPGSIQAVRIGWPVTLYGHAIPPATGLFPEGLAFSPDGKVIFAATTKPQAWPKQPVVFNTVAAGTGPGFIQPSASPTRVPATVVPRLPRSPTPTPSWMAPTSSAPLPIGRFGAMAADNAGGRVFVSSPAANSILVLDLRGNQVGTIPDEPGASSLLLDRTALYVLLFDVGAIDVIDTATMHRTRTLARGLLPLPHSLALAGGRLWTSSGDCLLPQMQLASVDVASGEVATYRLEPLKFCQQLAASRVDQNLLALAGDYVTRIDVSGPVPVVGARYYLGPAEPRDDLVMTPDGRSFFLTGVANQLEEHSAASLRPDGLAYATRPGRGASAVAISPDGRFVAAGIADPYGPSIDVFKAGDPRPIASFALAQGQLLLSGALAFDRTGRSLFAVSRPPSTDGRLIFSVLDIT